MSHVLSDFAVVIVNWHGTNDIIRCVEQFNASEAHPRLIVVDNSADGDLARELKRRGLEHSLLLLDAGANLGFARASNLGARAAVAERASYVMFLNPDTSFAVDALLALFSAMAATTGIGALGPVVLNEDGTVQSRGARVSKATFAVLELGADDDRPDFITGACLVVSAETVRRYGPFDERYFMYWEDADLCARLARDGLAIVVDPRSTIVHARSTTHGRAGVAIDRYQASSLVIFASTLGPAWYPGCVLRLVMRIVRRALAGRGDNVSAVVAGVRSGLQAVRRGGKGQAGEVNHL